MSSPRQHADLAAEFGLRPLLVGRSKKKETPVGTQGDQIVRRVQRFGTTQEGAKTSYNAKLKELVT